MRGTPSDILHGLSRGIVRRRVRPRKALQLPRRAEPSRAPGAANRPITAPGTTQAATVACVGIDAVPVEATRRGPAGDLDDGGVPALPTPSRPAVARSSLVGQADCTRQSHDDREDAERSLSSPAEKRATVHREPDIDTKREATDWLSRGSAALAGGIDPRAGRRQVRTLLEEWLAVRESR